jgi:non-specific protein-tyrosine kinase
LKTPEDINQFLHQPVIGFIAEMEKPRGKDKDNKPGVFASENPLSPITEAFRTLRSNLDFASVDKPLKTLLITSASPSEGKSTISVNLAAVIAQGERKVALVDTDLRRPTIHRFLKIANRRGLSDLFREHTSLSSVISTWGEPPIQVITSGGQPPNPTELLASERMEKILTELSQKFEFIVIDSPPAIVADPIIMAAKVDGVVLVIEPGKTKIGAAQVVLEQMSRAGARIIGVVMNPISKRRANYYTKYRYYSTYYYYSRGYSHYSSDNGSGKRRFGLKAKEGDGKVGAPKE